MLSKSLIHEFMFEENQFSCTNIESMRDVWEKDNIYRERIDGFEKI